MLKVQLTKREKEILKLIITGISNQRIAEALSITIRTVKFHTNNIYTKLSVKTRAEAIALVLQNRRVHQITLEH